MMSSGHGKTLALTPSGDLRLNGLNRLEWVSGKRAVVQRLKVTLATIQGEDQFDTEHGLDVFSVSGGTPAELELELVEALSRDKDVQSVDEVEIESDPSQSRRSIAHITVTLVEGDTVEFGAGI